MARTEIKNAFIADGLGCEPQLGCVTFTENAIESVKYGESKASSSEHIASVDAMGRVLAPGFIDLHSHADYSVLGSPSAETQLTQGVTTLLLGNCGFSPFPVKSVETARARAAFFHPEFIGDWEDTAGFVELVRAARPGVNVALQVGLSAVREFVMGDEARPIRSDEFAAMHNEIRNAISQGIRGFSSGLIYAPGSFSAPNEVFEILAPVAQAGLLYSTHVRNESGQVLESVEEAVAAARATGVRLEVSHVKAIGPENHGKMPELLQLLEEARASGVDVTGDVYPYTASSTTLSSRLPSYALEGGLNALVARLGDPSARAHIARDLAYRFGRDIDPAGVVVADLGPSREWDTGRELCIGKSLVEIAERDQVTPQESAMRLLENHHGSVLIVNHAMAESDVEAALRHPLISVASDGNVLSAAGTGHPHPRSFGTFTRVLGRYVRERGTLSLGEAVRKMTSLPASRMRLHDRGRIAVGMRPDLVLFDPDTVSDRATFEDPWRLSEGVHEVWVNGEHALRDGEITGNRAGRLL